ncbi:acyl carrier protein [Frankia sp. Ag45/Mut15]|uniref:Acyl carrier protein n=1 Tax=Frankia umida TaxID=573489 RepID=A0ABT0K2X1_9ACTN|nr:acyl carrier protein [Frankia umida]MCK9877842.1 acyl carrier protein [Frankia umida]
MTKLERIPESAAITAWLTGRVAYYLEREPDQIAPDAPLVGLGLDSVYALTLCGDIEDEYGLPVETTLAWDYPTVSAITEFLRSELSAGETAGR